MFGGAGRRPSPRCAESWLEFCPKYLKISRTEADRTIKLLEEFGPTYFEMRGALAKKTPESPEQESLRRQIDALCHETVLMERIGKLDRCGQTLVAEFEKVGRDKNLGEMASYFSDAICRVLDGLMRVVEESKAVENCTRP